MGLTIEEQRERIRAKKREMILSGEIDETIPSVRISTKKKKPKLPKPERKKIHHKIQKQLCAKYCIELRQKATPSEKLFRKKLIENKILHRFQKGYMHTNSNFYIADFVIPSLKLIVEIDGGYHLNKTQKKKDKAKDIYYTNVLGFKVLRILNENVKKFDIEKIKVLEKPVTKYAHKNVKNKLKHNLVLKNNTEPLTELQNIV
jgi:very-short-patch-repair endonuclease